MKPGPDTILDIALRFLSAGDAIALATVTATWRSAPRRPGAMMLITRDGQIHGSVSGGCVEAAVVAEAEVVLETSGAKRLQYGVADANAFAVGLSCGGEISVYLECIAPGSSSHDWIADLSEAIAARRAVLSEIDLNTGARRLKPYDAAAPLPVTSSHQSVFRHVIRPSPRLILVGAVHIAQALAPMARLAGQEVIVCDPRAGFASAERFPNENIMISDAVEAFATLGLDTDTAVVTLSHDPKIDDLALIAALDSPAYYIGCLGSTRTHAARLERLAAAGVPTDALARLHGPVGQPIGAETPEEIAVSILADITRAYRAATQQK